MNRPHRRYLATAGILVAILVTLALLYMLGMEHFEGKQRTFWQALQWAAGTTSTTGYSVDTSWSHPVMVVFVVVAQFVGVGVLFVILPIYLMPFLEERFETKLPSKTTHAKDHVVIFDHDATVETLMAELTRAGIPSVIIDEDESQARHALAQGYDVIYGNIDEGVLEKCNLRRARALIVNSSDDRDAATILAARQLGYTGEIIALVEDPFHRHPMLLAGASEAYTPRHVLGAALAARASDKVSPVVAGLPMLGGRVGCSEARIVRGGALAGRTLREAGLAGVPGLSIVGQSVAGNFVPAATSMRLEPGGILLAVGCEAGLRAFAARDGLHALRRDGRFLIAGCGEVGRKMAELLADAGEATFTIDTKAGRGVDLVGNTLDRAVLEQADLANARAVILAVSADATAIFGTVIVRDMAPDVPVIARVNLAENVERLYAAGADFALSVSQVSGQMLASRLLGRQSMNIDARVEVVRIPARDLLRRYATASEVFDNAGCAVVAVDHGGEMLVEPAPDLAFRDGDVAYVCGDAAGARALLA